MPSAASLSGERPKPVRPRRRIAVVFVHGQGEQTPMTDVVALAQSVWRTDPRAGGGVQESIFKAAVEAEPELASVYSVPIYDQENSDQRRIVTRIVDGVQIDFYQHYWADLMEGSRFTHLWRWFLNLMKREPVEVPGQLWSIRQLTMALALFVGLWGGLVGLLTAGRLGWALVLMARPNRFAPDLLEAFGRGWPGLTLAIAGALLAAAAWFVGLTGESGRGRSSPGRWWLLLLGMIAAVVGLLQVLAVVAGAFGLSPTGIVATALAVATLLVVAALLRPRWRSMAFSLGGGLLIVAILADLVWTPAAEPDWLAAMFGPAQFLTLAVGLAGAFFFLRLNAAFLTPVMADSARLFSKSPVNVPNQNRIRDRGMRLLEALHDPKGERRYDRVIVLAHSLGTVVAYRLLAHYWGKVQPKLDFNNAAASAQCAGLEAAAAHLDAGPDRQDALLAWRSAVRSYGAALNTGPRGKRRWLITDFITIGAPLTYAKLLMAETDQEFLDDVRLYKRHPTSPPQPREPDGSMFDHFWLHHAAMFATTCWTNLYFPPAGLVAGDIIGGIVKGEPPNGLGHGVLDVSLGHDDTVKGFSHNDYWVWPRNEPLRVSPAKPRGATPRTPPHVAALRDALGLFNRSVADFEAADRRLLDPKTSYP